MLAVANNQFNLPVIKPITILIIQNKYIMCGQMGVLLQNAPNWC